MIYDRLPSKSLTEYGFNNPTKRMELKKMKKEVIESIEIKDGKHTGVIKDIDYKTSPYEYVNILVEETDTKLKIKCGVPFVISEKSALGVILGKFGAKLDVGKAIEIEDFIKKETAVEFETTTDVTKRGTFSNISPMTFKPKE